jgi:shikimate dehydrogenase
LIQGADYRGCAVLDGLGMLVNQGVIAIELWFGRAPKPEIMRHALATLFSTLPDSDQRHSDSLGS